MGQHKGSTVKKLAGYRALEALEVSLAKMAHTKSPDDKQLSLEVSIRYDFYSFSIFYFTPFTNQEITESLDSLTGSTLPLSEEETELTFPNYLLYTRHPLRPHNSVFLVE